MAKKILLVDDEQDTATVFETVLKQAGYEVVVANSGQNAISTAKQGGFSLILMDQMMPDMSGNDALQQIKSDPNLASIPISMLSNFSHDQLVTEALGRGANDYILKYQISHEDLIKKVKEMIGEPN